MGHPSHVMTPESVTSSHWVDAPNPITSSSWLENTQIKLKKNYGELGFQMGYMDVMEAEGQLTQVLTSLKYGNNPQN